MGLTSKPLYIVLEQSLYDSNKDRWNALMAQGHIIEIITGKFPDLYFASFAMRMTVDMLNQLPAAFDLAVKGARTLRYPPVSKDATAWKGKRKVKVRKCQPVNTQD